MFRKRLSASGLYETVRSVFNKIKDFRVNRESNISYNDALLSATAMFALKSPSLLAFEGDFKDNSIKGRNLRSLFGIEEIPSDTTMREIVDEIPTEVLYKPFKKIFSDVQRGKNLEPYIFMDDKYLIAIDGTGFFSSNSVHCKNCCTKKHKNGEVTYHHQALCAVLIHPDHKAVIPFSPEPIVCQDGETKNDCERNASKRLLLRLRREHPHLNFILTEDGLSSNAPRINLVKDMGAGFIYSCKPGDHQHLFEFIDASEKLSAVTHHELSLGKSNFKFRFMNDVPLNDKSQLPVNFLECWETRTNGQKLHFSWVVDQTITKENCYQLMRGGRARWRIENETFNTLKNQGYNFEHNYGHGNKNLSNNLMVLMMLVFLIDQVQLLCCKTYQKALEQAGAFYRLWQEFKSLISKLVITSWDDLIAASAFGVTVESFFINTS